MLFVVICNLMSHDLMHGADKQTRCVMCVTLHLPKVCAELCDAQRLHVVASLKQFSGLIPSRSVKLVMV